MQTALIKKAFSRHASWLGYLLAAFGFLLSVMAFYPGYMTPDSIDQWHQAQKWDFWDYHPPLMAAVWGILDRIIPGPAGMLFFHNAMFWGAAALFWRAMRRTNVALGLCLIAFAFMPQVLALLGTIWKDVGFGASLFMASALLYTAHKSGSKLALLLSCPFLFYAYAARLNAAPAVLPLAFWTSYLACGIFPFKKMGTRMRRFLPLAFGAAYMLLLTVAIVATTQILTKGKTTHPSQFLLLHDLAAISKARGEAVFPDYVLKDKDFSLERVIQRVDTYAYSSLVLGNPAALKMTMNPDELSALKAKWAEAVMNNKAAYLKHRWEIFVNLIGFNTQHVVYPYNFAGYGYNPAKYKPAPGALNQSLMDYFWYFKRSLFFRGFFWLLLSMGLVYLSLRGRLRGDFVAVFVLAASGVLYTATYFFISPSTEFRYLWWTALAAVISTLLLVAEVVASRQHSPVKRPAQDFQPVPSLAE